MSDRKSASRFTGGGTRPDAKDIEIAALRARLQAAEAERDALGNEAVDRLMLVATIRTRAEQAEAERDALLGADRSHCPNCGTQLADHYQARRKAEAERDEARAAWDGWQGRYCAIVREREEARDQRDAALAEVARLRGEYERGLREAAGVCKALADRHADAAQSILDDHDRADAEAQQDDFESELARESAARLLARRILALLDAAPAAEVSDV